MVTMAEDMEVPLMDALVEPVEALLMFEHPKMI